MSVPHDRADALVDGYVLGTLSEAEATEFAAHLADCEPCRRRTREVSVIAEALGRALPQVQPPHALRERVLAQILTDPSGARRDSITPARDRRASRSGWLAVAATLVALVASGAAWYYRQEATRAREEQQVAARQALALEQQVNALQARVSTATQTHAVLTAGDLTRVDLAGQSPAPGARGRVFWSPTHGLVFAATNLPPLPPGRVYQLWVVGDAPASAGIAEPAPAGGLSVVSKPTPTGAAKAFAVTIEPEGGRPAPTGPMYLLGAM